MSTVEGCYYCENAASFGEYICGHIPQPSKPNNIIRGDAEIQIIGLGTLALLKILSTESPQKRSRMILHESHESPVQEMVIAMTPECYFRPHKHPIGKTESYHIIEGEMDVRIFNESGKTVQSIRLDASTPLYRIKGGIYHQPVAASAWCIYHEVFSGPFDKSNDVSYADWAAEEIE